jgi:hypothetical protein
MRNIFSEGHRAAGRAAPCPWWRRRPGALLVAAGVLLALPALSNRLVLDDLLLLRRLRPAPATEAQGDGSGGGLFTFATGSPSDAQRRMDAGDLLPWWTSPELKVSFFRPLTAATHALDARLWPRTPWLMQAQSLVFYALLLVVVGSLYDRVARRAASRHPAGIAATITATAAQAAALLALMLFVLDDNHGATLSWLANRNAILTTLFGAAALWSHHRLRADGWRPGRVLTPALLAAGLLAGEAAVATLGYLAAYALFLEPWPPRKPGRLWSLVPSLAVALTWQVAYRVLRHGVTSSGVYADPAHAPVAFLGALAQNGLGLAGAALGLTSADLLVWGPRAAAPLVLATAALGIAALGFVAWPVLRVSAAARFWSTGAVLALGPIAASLPGDRLLLFVSVGAMGFLGEVFGWYLARWRVPFAARAMVRGRLGRIFWVGLLFRRTLFALVLLPLRTHAMQPFALGADAADAAIRRFGPGADTVVFVNAPCSPDVSYLAARWALAGRPAPPRVRWLAEGRDGVRVTRVGEHTLRVAPEGGFLEHATERLYRDRAHPLGPGAEIHLAGMTAHVVSATLDGRPAVVDFVFTDELQRRGRLWLTWRDGQYQPFPLPQAGESAVFAPAETLTLSLAVHPPDGHRPGRSARLAGRP